MAYGFNDDKSKVEIVGDENSKAIFRVLKFNGMVTKIASFNSYDYYIVHKDIDLVNDFGFTLDEAKNMSIISASFSVVNGTQKIKTYTPGNLPGETSVVNNKVDSLILYPRITFQLGSDYAHLFVSFIGDENILAGLTQTPIELVAMITK